jgi:hypothetical protein
MFNYMGINASKISSEVSIKRAINATLSFTANTSTNASGNQSLQFTNNTNLNVDGLTMQQTVTIKLKVESNLDAVSKFQSTIQDELKQNIKQETEMGTIANNKSESVKKLAEKYSLDCSKVFQNNLSAFLSSNQSVVVTGNSGGLIRNIKLAQTVESATDTVIAMIVRDSVVNETKTALDLELGQKASGFSSIFKALLGPLICICILGVLFLLFKFTR